ncbi:MAG: hypothetical protein PHF13_06390, partial [Acholeplasmataceae bacterium]|nr:hypothetical protein [Acholeplasmataceae bacterium]
MSKDNKPIYPNSNFKSFCYIKSVVTNPNIIYRPETQKDYYQSEHMTQKAFWNLYIPGCSEHYLVHKLRDHPDYIKELTLLAVDGEKVVGLI